MDYGKEHNGWQTFQEHWGITVTILLMVVLVLFLLPMATHLHKTAQTIESDDSSGDMSSDAGSVYWNVLSEPATNRIEFVLLLPVTTTIGSGSINRPADAYDYCNLQIKSNGHQWKIEDVLDWKTGVRTLQVRDLTANTTEPLQLDNARYWQLDEGGNAKPIEKIDPTVMAKILTQVKANQTNRPGAQLNTQN